MKFKSRNSYQMLSHLMIIALVPLLVAAAYTADNWSVKGLLMALLLFLVVFIWKKILK